MRLRDIAAAMGNDRVILRPPMVYGANARGNFGRLVKLVASGLPLPLGCATAPRSFIGIANMADAVTCCVRHPQPLGDAYLITDAQPGSTAALIDAIAHALGRRLFNLRVPPCMFAPHGRH